MTYSGLTRAKSTAAVLLFAAALGLSACGPSSSNYPGQPTGRGGPNNPTGEERESIFGEEGLKLFGGSASESEQGGGGIGVNSFLWRASLDTISFMPLASADPFGGVIITDWYQDPKAAGERFKLTVYILDKRLRADGVKVAVFRQNRAESGEWVDAKVAPETAIQIENAILVRARQLRINTIEAQESK
ncbi:MAG: DUF3576 domain-containing protein [Parvibaculum sp.]